MKEFKLETVNPTQKEFVYCPKRFSCWDGGVWTGKSAGGVLRAHALSALFPGNRGAIFRYVEEDLKRTTLKTFRDLVDPAFYDPQHGGRDIDGYTKYINGSEILWMHLKDLNVKALMSLEIAWFFIDQAEECEASAYEMLESRLRWRPPDYRKGGKLAHSHFPQYGFIVCNPNGRDWIYYKFHPDVALDTRNYAYFFTTTEQNGEELKKQNPEYFKTLQMKPESWKRRFFYGSRDVSEGAWHKEFNKRIHVYDPKTFDIFKERRIRSIDAFYDYGLSAETACLWVATDSEGFRWFFREWYGVKGTIRTNAEALMEVESRIGIPINNRLAEPQIFIQYRKDSEIAIQTGNMSVADEYAMYGMAFTQADNSEETAWERIESALHVEPTRINPVTGALGSPKWFFSSACPNAVEQTANQRRKLKRNPLTGESEYTEERDPNVTDHCYDCVRYCGNYNVEGYQPYHGELPRLAKTYAKV